jgi:large subunit ribosomal protein L21
MFAVIEMGGKQYRVHKGEYLNVDRVAEAEGATLAPRVLLAGDGDRTVAGADLAQVSVTARVDEHLLGPKVRVGFYRPKQHSKKTRGHRSRLTKITIEDIALGSAKGGSR